MYYSRATGQASTESVLAAPFALTRISTGLANAPATFEAPFAQPFPTSASFPLFVPYSSSTKAAVNALAPNFRPALVQQFSLNAQVELRKDWLLEVGYVGTRGTHLQRFRSLNQALDASPENPVNGIRSNTLANIGLRVPVPGIRPDALQEIESEGSSWYNGLEISLAKRLSHGLQFLASYTFSKILDTDGSDINSTSSGNALTLETRTLPVSGGGVPALTALIGSFSAPRGLSQTRLAERYGLSWANGRWPQSRLFSPEPPLPSRRQIPPMSSESARSGPIKRRLLDKPFGKTGSRRVETQRLFQRVLFYQRASDRG